MTRTGVAYLAVGLALLITAGLLLGRRGHSQSSVPATASAFPSALPSASNALRPSEQLLPFIFDCAGLGAAQPACAATPEAERQLLALVGSYHVSASACAKLLPEAGWDNVSRAFRNVQQLEAKALTAVERALLQNAALEVLSCASKLGSDPKAQQVSVAAKSIIRKLTLDEQEIAALPAATALIEPWLGDGSSWQRGIDAVALHTQSEGYARAHQQLQRADTLADVVRLVLVNQRGEPFVTDTVQRVVLRRKALDAVHVCIAELEPGPASCGPAALRPLEPARVGEILSGARRAPPCMACHPGNIARAKPYGPDVGFQLSEEAAARIQSGLKGLALH